MLSQRSLETSATPRHLKWFWPRTNGKAPQSLGPGPQPTTSQTHARSFLAIKVFTEYGLNREHYPNANFIANYME